jgi:NAD(P)-dependent dehydrogenase (short-subunit alcohol dehydrogenase family)
VTRLTGKIALITGGGTGIGRACALLFARECARVAIAGRRREPLEETAEEIRAAGGEALAVQCDVSKAADAARAVAETAARFGGLNVLVNSAGILSTTSVEATSEEEWDRVMAANLKGPYLMSRAALGELRKAGGGSIVNIGSILGLVAYRDRAAYCASKGGVTMLTKAMALDHAREGIRVNCICPAIVETDMVKAVIDKMPDPAAVRRARTATIPLGRMGRPEDPAHMAVYLASEESSWVTGAAFPLDGGLSAY